MRREVSSSRVKLRKKVVVDVTDEISLKIEATGVIEQTGNRMIEMRTQPC